MKERPSASPSPEQEKPGPNQADIDALYLKLARYEAPEAATDPIVRTLLARDGLEFSEASIAAGTEMIDGIPCDIAVEFAGLGQKGEVDLTVSVRDRFNRDRGETLRFEKEYRLQPSDQALANRRLEKEQEERADAIRRVQEEKVLIEALKIFRPYAAARLGKTLTAQDWERDPHGLRGVVLQAGIPEHGRWIITDDDAGHLRVTIRDAQGAVHDVYEFEPET